MKSESSETVGPTSSRGSDVTGSTLPQKPKRARANTNRDNLELDQPLSRIEPVMTPVSTRRGVYAPTDRKGVKRSFWINTSIGLVMIAILIFGSIFGVIFAVVETHGALKAGGTPDYDSTTSCTSGSSTLFVTSTLVPSSFTTLAPSRYLTLVPTEMTVYVQSQATTLILSEATTLVQSLVTITQRDTITSVEVASIGPTVLVKKNIVNTSTTGFTMSVTTTVTISVYSTTFGHDDLQSELRGNGDPQNTCGNDAQSSCVPTTTLVAGPKSTFVKSTILPTLVSFLDANFTTATTTMSDNATAPAMTTANPRITDVVTVTYSVSLVCAATDISSRLACIPLPTGWYISASTPRATSVLHSVFRFITICFNGIKDSGIYEFLRSGFSAFWNLCGKAFINFGDGPVSTVS